MILYLYNYLNYKFHRDEIQNINSRIFYYNFINPDFKFKGTIGFEAGIRVGRDFSIDATFPLSKAPRLHTAFYVEGDFGLGTYLDWMFSLDGGPQGLKFFPGVGPEFYFGNDFNMGIAGDFGMEYSFKFPLTLGIDYRPGFMITDSFKGYSWNWGITARFRFVKA